MVTTQEATMALTLGLLKELPYKLLLMVGSSQLSEVVEVALSVTTSRLTMEMVL
jgi:hypothetical protein